MTDPKTIITQSYSREFLKMLNQIKPLNTEEKKEIEEELEEYEPDQIQELLDQVEEHELNFIDQFGGDIC